MDWSSTFSLLQNLYISGLQQIAISRVMGHFVPTFQQHTSKQHKITILYIMATALNYSFNHVYTWYLISIDSFLFLQCHQIIKMSSR